MTKIKYAQEIPIDKLSFNSKKEVKQESSPAFRLYSIDKKGKAKGFWQDNGKLYRDKITFVNYSVYLYAKRQALTILKNTKEICVSLEDIKKNTLYIIYRDKITVLRIKKSFKTLNKRQALTIAHKLTIEQGGATLYRDKLYYRIISYK